MRETREALELVASSCVSLGQEDRQVDPGTGLADPEEKSDPDAKGGGGRRSEAAEGGRESDGRLDCRRSAALLASSSARLISAFVLGCELAGARTWRMLPVVGVPYSAAPNGRDIAAAADAGRWTPPAVLSRLLVVAKGRDGCSGVEYPQAAPERGCRGDALAPALAAADAFMLVGLQLWQPARGQPGSADGEELR